ncbi:MAG: hypothetical protein ACXVB9_12840 [Bdellovibrionota bacterium]
MKRAIIILSLLFTSPTQAGNNAVNESCKSLCNSESDCVRRCVGQAELFELKSDFINAVTEWTKNPDDRMRALRSGANHEILQLCQSTGWSLDNKMICLRSYPTPDVIKSCKKLSPLQEEQVRCVRMGKTEAEVDACNRLVPGSDRRLECLERNVSAQDSINCRNLGGDTFEKMSCLRNAEGIRMGEARKMELDDRIRAEREKNRARAPASSN